MKETLLTLAIPTYNRQKKLQECLSIIEKQKLVNTIEILISDNGSTDKTEHFVKIYKNTHLSNIRYIKNQINLGFDRNIVSLYKHAKGKYIWFFSDDDIMLPGALERVLYILKTNMPTALYPNHVIKNNVHIYNNRFVDIVDYMPTGIGTRVKTDTLLTLTDEISRLAMVRILGFTSCCLIKKDSGVNTVVEKMCGNGMVQTAITSICLKKKPVMYISSKACVKSGDKDYFPRWFMESNIFGIYDLYMNNYQKLGYSKYLVKKLCINTCIFALLILAQKNVWVSQYIIH
jgi:glycosyltransferase involved in cell wall biosynthesis